MIRGLWRHRTSQSRERALTAMLGVLLMLSTVSSTAAPASIDSSTTVQPNIVILYADDMGWGDTGAYGHPYIKTPSLTVLPMRASAGPTFMYPLPCARRAALHCSQGDILFARDSMAGQSGVISR